MRNEIKGGILIMVAAFFWGISGTIIKILFNHKMDPFVLVNMRLNLSFAIMFIFFYIFRRSIVRIKRKDLKFLAILGIFGITGVQSSYYFTVSALNVSMAIFLQFLAPILVMVYCVIFQKERLNLMKITALLLAVSGSFFIIFGRGNAAVPIKTVGLISGIASALFCAFYYIYGKKCTDAHNPWTVLLYAVGAGALLYWFVSPPWVLWRSVSPEQVLAALYISVFATIIPFGLYLTGSKYLSSATASIIAMLEPVVASLSAFMVLGEVMAPLQIVGGLAVIAAVAVIQINESKAEADNKI